jgi:hypothetical protein
MGVSSGFCFSMQAIDSHSKKKLTRSGISMLLEWPAISTPISRTVVTLLSAMLLPAIASAQARDEHGPQGPATGMATRSVSKYLGIERALQEAIAAHDRATVAGLLDPEFIQRTAASDDPLSQEEWLNAEFGNSNPGGRVRDMLVIEADDLATVSFLLDTTSRKGGKGGRHTYFVVDVWRQSTGKLRVRYSDTPTNPPSAQPGAHVRE